MRQYICGKESSEKLLKINYDMFFQFNDSVRNFVKSNTIGF